MDGGSFYKDYLLKTSFIGECFSMPFFKTELIDTSPGKYIILWSESFAFNKRFMFTETFFSVKINIL